MGILISMPRLVLAYAKRLFDFRLIKSMFSSYCFTSFRPLLGTLAAEAHNTLTRPLRQLNLPFGDRKEKKRLGLGLEEDISGLTVVRNLFSKKL